MGSLSFDTWLCVFQILLLQLGCWLASTLADPGCGVSFFVRDIGSKSHLASTPVAKLCPESSLRSRRSRLQVAELQAWLREKPSTVQHPPPILAHLSPHLRALDTQVPLLSQHSSSYTAEHLLCVRPQTLNTPAMTQGAPAQGRA